jgi:transposase
MVSIAYFNVFVGLDYHDCWIQVCVVDDAGNTLGNRRVPNDATCVGEFVDQVSGGRGIGGAAIEACCGTANLAEELQRKFDWEVHLAHAGICSKMKQNPDKTDFSDAHLLADLCRVGYLPRVWLPPRSIRDLRRLGRYRDQLVQQRRNAKLRIRAMLREERIAAPSEAGNAWTVAWKRWVKGVTLDEHSRWVMDEHLDNLERVSRKVREVEGRMEKATQDDPVVQKLRETKGVGLVTAVVMRAEIGSFDRFRSGKQLARYCALTPRNVSSGSRQADGGLINAGHLNLRTMLIEAAHRLARYIPKWRQLKEQLKSAGKPTSVATAAIANRWVRKLYWEMRQASPANAAA